MKIEFVTEPITNLSCDTIILAIHDDTAMLDQTAAVVDKMLDVAMDDSKDVLQGPNGPVSNYSAVRRADTQIKVLQWTASRLNRAKWGDKQDVEVRQTTTNLNIDITPGKFDAMDISDACQIFTQK